MSTTQPSGSPLVGLLRQPVQARSRATFESILQAAIDILEKEGLTALNTNRVAEEAGVNIATLYSYFANKEGILAHLADRFEDERASSVEAHALTLGEDPDWKRWFAESIDAMVQFRVRAPGWLVVRQAVAAIPELAVLDHGSTQRATRAKVPGLRKLNAKLSEEQAHKISRFYTLTATAMLDEAFRTNPYDEDLIAELKQMIFVYLGIYLPQPSITT